MSIRRLEAMPKEIEKTMRENVSNRTGTGLVVATLIAAICTSLYSYNYGEPAAKRAEAARLKAFAVTSESIRVSTTNASLELTPIPERLSSRSGYHPGWALLRTDSWVIVPNADEGKALCPSVLGDFIDAHKAEGKKLSWTLRNIDAVLSGHKNMTVDMEVFVPRPQAPPTGLAACPALRFDAARKMLTVSGLPLAVLANKQTLEMPSTMPPRSVARFIY